MSIENIRNKYFVTNNNKDFVQKQLENIINKILNWYNEEKTKKICSDISLPDLELIFTEMSIPSDGLNIENLLDDVQKRVLEHSVRLANPYFIGHMQTITPYINLLADLIISALNQNVVKIESALSATFIERQTLAWLHELIYKKSPSYYRNVTYRVDIAIGNITNGGTMSTLTALTVARNQLLPNAHIDGIYEAMFDKGIKKIVILASKRVHYSIKKVAAVLGIGSHNVIEIPVDNYSNKINIGELELILNQLERHKVSILAIVGVAGTTETGNIDNLNVLAEICSNRGIWFHVDAAWGGAILLSNQYSYILDGINKADSIVIDGHKLFYLPMTHGAVLFKSERSLDLIKHSAHYIIRPGSVDLGRTSLEGSRRFDSLKLWMSFKHLGKNTYEELIDYSIMLATEFALIIKNHSYFELTSLQETNIITYRYMPKNWKDFFEDLSCNDNNEQDLLLNNLVKRKLVNDSLTFLQDFINELNIEIQKQQRNNGKSFVSRTTLESVNNGFSTVVLRAVLFNPLTTIKHLQEILAEQAELGYAIARNKWKKKFSRNTVPQLVFNYFSNIFSIPSSE